MKRDTHYRQKLGISSDTALITFIGRLIYAKGVHDLLSAFSRIKEVVPDTKLLIVGDGYYRVHLENLACQNDCSDGILFLGQKNQDEVIDILSATDIFVSPSYSEALSISVMEAASIGLPIVATDVGSTREIIVDHETGMLIKPADVAQLEIKLCELLGNAELRKKFGENTRISVKRKFDWDEITEKHIKLYTSLLKE